VVNLLIKSSLSLRSWEKGSDFYITASPHRFIHRSFGAVYKGVHQESRFELAIKVLQNIENDEEIENEIEILKKCKHNSVVVYYGSSKINDDMWILMEFCAMGSIRDMIVSCKKPLTEPQLQWVTLHTLKGLVYLHQQGIIHR